MSADKASEVCVGAVLGGGPKGCRGAGGKAASRWGGGKIGEGKRRVAGSWAGAGPGGTLSI